MNSKELEHDDQVRNDQHSEPVAHHEKTPSDEHGDRMVGVSIFHCANIVTPRFNRLQKWREVRRILMCRTTRAEKDGPLIGGYILTCGGRCDANVKTRSLVQLDIDTKIDKATSEILKRAPPFADIRNIIDKFEYVAASSHNHDPGNGLIKYRVTFLPDRVIKEEEYEPLLETLDDWLGGILDRDAWIWSQAFYLPSCPGERTGDAFTSHNAGALLPVDIAVEHGRQIIAARDAAAGPSTGSGHAGQTGATSSATAGPRTPPPETAEEIARVVSMLAAIDSDTDRKTWRQVCWAVLATRWDCAEKLIREWSERGKKFEETDFTKVVASFDPAGGTGVGSLVYHARQSGWQDPVALAGSVVDPTQFKQTDAGNALLFTAMYKDDIRYIEAWRTWAHWNGERWGLKSDAALLPLARHVTEHMFSWAATLPDDHRTALRKHALATQREQRLHAMINLAKGEPTIRAAPKQFDAEPWLLGCENVTLDLRARKTRRPRREDFITKSTGIDPDPEAACPNWLATLDWTMQGDAATIEHLQRVAGYMLTGSVREEKLFAFFGGGSNGKTTITMTFLEALGDYAAKGRKDLLLQSQGEKGAASPDVAALHGKRLVVVSETDQGCTLAEAQVKEITSNEPITARKLHCDPFTFYPSQKIILMTNHRPFVKGSDEGIWRRLELIGFNAKISDDEKELHFREEKLRPEFPAILAWMIRGCFMWQRDGLKPSAAVTNATKAYRSEMDFIQQWLDERTIADPKANIPRKETYADYIIWSQLEHAPTLGNRRFVEELHGRGFPTTKSHGVRLFQGLRLKTKAEVAAEEKAREKAKAKAKAKAPPLRIVGGTAPCTPKELDPIEFDKALDAALDEGRRQRQRPPPKQ